MERKSFLEARNSALQQYKEAKAEFVSDPEQPAEDLGEIDPKLFDYFFEAQVEVEQQGSMDYHAYAKKIWRSLAGKNASEKGLAEFEHRMIAALHEIDMRKIVYPEVAASLGKIVENYAGRIENFILWSAGDVAATGYQPGKISRSRIVEQFYHTLAKDGVNKAQGAKRIMRQKTTYMVEDNKFNALSAYIQDKFDKDPEEQIKLVVVEDSVKNIAKVKDLVEKRFLSHNIQVIPIWATYSREGKEARQRNRGAFERQSTELNGIDSFAEMADVERFGEVFDGADVLVDFDGVIGDNEKMRELQAQAIYRSLVAGGKAEPGADAESFKQKLLSNLEKLKKH